MAEIVPAVALKVAVDAADATVTDGGTIRAAVELDSATAVPPTGAASERVIVQVLDAPALRVAGAQVSADTDTGWTKLIKAVREAPFTDAVMVTV